MLRSAVPPITAALLGLAPVASAQPAVPTSRMPPDIPAAFAVGDRQAVLTAHAVGAQIYECHSGAGAAPAWTFREPIASLMGDGKTIGRHYAGPTWELADSSRITGKVIATAPGRTPDDIPELELQVVDHRGPGVLDGVGTVLRVHTVGGRLAGTCAQAGDLRSVPYAADYVFIR